MDGYKILVVDDEEDICEILQFNLEHEGFEVQTANSAEEALKLDLRAFDLLLLDVMMGEISGFKMTNIIRRELQQQAPPVIFITAKDTENDTLTGFNLGAEDYISKPFSIKEVIARVRVTLRRYPKYKPILEEQISFRGLEIILAAKKVRCDGEEVLLTKKEFEILRLLLSHINQVFSREQILHKVWTDEVYVLDRTVDVNITRLRKKLGDYGAHIVTRLGYGYCFED